MADGNDVTLRMRSPAKDGATRRRVLDLRMMVIANLAPGYDGGPLSVDRDSFSAVLERLAPRLDIEVPDLISRETRPLPCSLVVDGLDRLHPDGVVDAVPKLRGLVGARELISDCLEQRIALSDVRERLVAAFSGTDLDGSLRKSIDRVADGASASASATVDEGGSLEALLEKVAVPAGATAAPGPAELVDLLAAVAVPRAARVDRVHLEGLIRQIDQRLTRQIAAIQAHPEFQALEEAWRGLKFLLDRINFREGAELEVLPSTRDEFLGRFFEHVFQTEYEGRSELPLSFVLADYAFGRSVPELEMVQRMARLGESLSLPFVGAMDPSYWGVRQARLVPKLPDLIQKAQGSEYAKWNALRADPSSLWIFLVANRFLLRPLWAEASRPPKSFSWCAQDDAEHPLWGSAVWAIGAALGQSFAESGIRYPCVGFGSPGAVKDLPVVIRREGVVDPYATPLEVDFDDRRAFQLAQAGFAPLIALRGSDQAHFSQIPSFHRPSRYDDEEATRTSFLEATLPYRGFASAVAHELDRVGRRLERGLPPEQVGEKVRQGMLALLAPLEEGIQDPDSVKVEVAPNRDAPELLDVTARLRPGFTVYGREVDLIAGTSIPK